MLWLKLNYFSKMGPWRYVNDINDETYMKLYQLPIMCVTMYVYETLWDNHEELVRFKDSMIGHCI